MKRKKDRWKAQLRTELRIWWQMRRNSLGAGKPLLTELKTSSTTFHGPEACTKLLMKKEEGLEEGILYTDHGLDVK